MLKIKNIFTYFFLLSSFVLQAQLDNSIFWEIKANDDSKASYIFGTHHLYDFEFIKKNQTILDKLKQSDRMFGEIIINESDPSLIIKATLAMMMKDNSLDKLMSKEDYQATVAYVKKVTNIDIDKNFMFKKFKPMALQQIIMVSKYAQLDGDKNLEDDGDALEDMGSLSNSMDMFFQTKAKEYGAEVMALETADEQLKVLYDGYTLERQTEMLLETVYGNDEDLGELKNMNELYQSQNLEKLYSFIQKNMKENELKILLTDRNEKWIPIIDKHLKENKSLFIAVGAGHLPGQLGVLELLKNKGYIIKPVKIKISNN